MPPIDLRALRENAKIAQEALAERLGISQSQVSRGESDPDSLTVGVLMRWLNELGASPGVLEPELSANVAQVDPGEPYAELDAALAAVYGHLSVDPGCTVPGAPTPEGLREDLKRLGRRPRIVLAGRFDAGKSRVANAILGGNFLPTGYQPETMVPAYIRHIDRRPSFIAEPVWIMRQGFDPERWDDDVHCREHKVAGGTLEALKHYATKKGSQRSDDIGAALVFLDAPLLRACELVDLPGTDNDKADTDRAEEGTRGMDGLVFLSPFKGFLNASDLTRLSYYLRRLPDTRSSTEDEGGWENLLVVATHVSPDIRSDELDPAFDIAARRAVSEMGKSLLSLRVPDGDDEEALVRVLLGRFTPFWFETKGRREGLMAEVRRLVSQTLPRTRRRQLDAVIANARIRASTFFAAQADHYRSLFVDVEASKVQLHALKAQESERFKAASVARGRLREQIRVLAQECELAVTKSCDAWLSLERIEHEIRRYPVKNDAKDYITLHLIEAIQNDIAESTGDLHRGIAPQVDAFLALYSRAAQGLSSVQTPHPENSFFAAANVFAELLGAERNVGALAGWLAAAREKLPPTPGTVAPYDGPGLIGLATVGGAIALALAGSFLTAGVTVLAGLLTWALWGESWERRLARRVRKSFDDTQLPEQLRRQVVDHWMTTMHAFEAAADGLEGAYRSFVDELSVSLEQREAQRLQAERVDPLVRLEMLFKEIPWLPAEENEVQS